MVDAAPRSALADHLTPGRFGAEGHTGIAISEVRDRTLVNLAGDGDILATATGMSVPRSAGETQSAGDDRLLWLAPDQWLLIGPATPFGERERQLAAAAPDAAVNEVTFGRTTLRLAGPHARDVLAKGCPLDLDSDVFGAGQCAQSLLGHLSVLIECREPDVLEVTVTRSYGADLLHWLTTAAAEYGYEVSA